MTRRCSHCSHNGHNSRTCPGRAGAGGVRLFGVRLTEGVGSMKKSASMGCLSSAAAHLGSSAAASPGSPSAAAAAASGYASDDAAHASCSANCRTERKKGTPWTEEEHRMFLLGLQKLGKGDWRGIARNYVVSRTPTQVASHAQKYFIRQTNATRRKRRTSLFDMVPEMPVDEVPALEEQTFMLLPSPAERENMNQFPSLGLSQDQESEPVEASSKESPLELAENVQSNNQPLPIPMVPTFYPTFIPVPLPFWPPQKLNTPVEEEMRVTHEVLKPTPVLPKEPISVDEVVRMSRLSIGEGGATSMEPSALSLKLLGASTSRQSAFHLNPSIAGPDLSQSKSNAIHAN